MSWLKNEKVQFLIEGTKEKLSAAASLATKPIDWIQANKYKPLFLYLDAKDRLDQAIKQAEEEREARKNS